MIRKINDQKFKSKNLKFKIKSNKSLLNYKNPNFISIKSNMTRRYLHNPTNLWNLRFNNSDHLKINILNFLDNLNFYQMIKIIYKNNSRKLYNLKILT